MFKKILSLTGWVNLANKRLFIVIMLECIHMGDVYYYRSVGLHEHWILEYFAGKKWGTNVLNVCRPNE